jgi:hypothetical protein
MPIIANLVGFEAEILCYADWLAERAGFELSVQVSARKCRRLRSLHELCSPRRIGPLYALVLGRQISPGSVGQGRRIVSESVLKKWSLGGCDTIPNRLACDCLPSVQSKIEPVSRRATAEHTIQWLSSFQNCTEKSGKCQCRSQPDLPGADHHTAILAIPATSGLRPTANKSVTGYEGVYRDRSDAISSLFNQRHSVQ